ncbi:hypothetical protein B296_00042911 [Ensete ventricosum]|uniref:Uncharacterized protein n=1 Tax=Ensete ventricosum TaxID=4639 RepID=A0A426YCT6_ENSVE|nr:hypothetical protein B296_00042911 [Ensete ventricosum]
MRIMWSNCSSTRATCAVEEGLNKVHPDFVKDRRRVMSSRSRSMELCDGGFRGCDGWALLEGSHSEIFCTGGVLTARLPQQREHKCRWNENNDRWILLEVLLLSPLEASRKCGFVERYCFQ